MTAEPELEKTFVFYRTYPEMDRCILMGDVFWTLVLVVAAYLAFVLKIGPEFMKNRPPYKLKTVLIVYNLFQVVVSLVIAILAVRPLITLGIFPKTAPQMDPEIRQQMAYGSTVFYLGKFTELLDTVFFVLRKKYNQISFLHVYHHSSVIIGTWMVAKYGLSHSGTWGTFMNACVHVVMYFYYFMAGLGPQYQKYLTWKSYMTTFQIVQFVTVLIHQTVSIFYTKGEHSIAGILYIYSSAVIFLTLFCQFYIKNYTKPKKGDAKEAVDNGKKQ